MLRDLFVHVCIVITFLFLGGSIFRFSPILYSFRQKLLFGAVSGVLGSLLMMFSIHLTPTIIMDYRHIAILFSALYGGIISTTVSVFIICLSRYVFVGGSVITVLVATINMVCIGIFAAVMSASKLSELKKWIYMYLFSLVLITAGFEYLLGMTRQFYELMLEYWGISIVSGVLLFYCGNYIVHSNRSYYNMKKHSTTDFLTGLHNVRHFHYTFDSLIQKAKKYKEKLSILLIDVDNFKNINDTYGHETGDEVLRQMGELLTTCSRSFDIPSRIGGDEFSLLLVNCTNQQAVEISERIRKTFERHDFKMPDGKVVNFTVSIGVSTYFETTQHPDRLIKQADIALYKAKQAGRNKVYSSLAE